MPREVWPEAFTLATCSLADPAQKKQIGAALHLLGVRQQSPFDPRLAGGAQSGMPTALRWLTSGAIGFPRQPFTVWRRPAGVPAGQPSLISVPTDVAGTRTLSWGPREMYYVHVTLTPAAGQNMVLDALDRTLDEIAGQRVVVSTTRTVVFRCQGIAGLKVHGRGRITALTGVHQESIANRDDWRRVEMVGFPFRDGAVRTYAASPQGLAGALRDGPAASRVRLAVAQLMHLPPPATGRADVAVPDWRAPDPDAFLDALQRERRTAQGDPFPSLLGLIKECFDRADDSLAARQSMILHEHVIGGMRQADILERTRTGIADEVKVATLKLPILDSTLLQVAHDGFAATALGFGTIDIPPPGPVLVDAGGTEAIQPAGGGTGPDLTVYDYMVTAEFSLPVFGRRELAALACTAPAPVQPAITGARQLQELRPPARDAAANECVELEWRLSTTPQSYGIVVKRGGRVSVLNQPSAAGGHELFVPQRPHAIDGDPEIDSRTHYVDAVAPRPLTGTATHVYGVIGIDVFGRWSSWSFVDHPSTAPPVTRPDLHSVTLAQVDQVPADRAAVRYRIEIDLSWNWTDRTPDRIELVGAFHAAGSSPPAPASIAGVQLHNGGAAGSRLLLRFGPDYRATASGVPGAEVTLLRDTEEPVAGPHAPVVKRYRVVLPGVSVDFSRASRVSYSMYAQAAEAVRPHEPMDWAAAFRTGADGTLERVPVPVSAVIADPVAPEVPALIADVCWTALPDASGRARGLLEWPTVASAAGYFVWEATESALRAALGGPEAMPPETPYDRAMDLIDAMARASREVRNRVNAAFRRLNTHAIAAPPYEIEMPGRADTLFMYRITAISENQVESARTDAAVFFAVARRRAPGPPTVIIRRVDGGLRLTLTPAPGVETARYRIHRVRDVDLARDIGTMGPHVHELTGTEFVDDVPARWTPYYYRVVAIGAKDRENGYHPGESVPSSVAEGIRPPAAPPTLSTVEYVANTTNAVLTFRSDIPAVRGARIELQAYEADGDRVTRAFETLASLDGPELDLIASPSARELSAMPELRRQAPDRYTLRMLTFARGSIIVRDPLGRSTQISFPPVT